ncbi:M48 family metalloprotease [Polymorphobacter sp. PAMC 29334]|nr:M48 family metalloprotease [Polymorphobacter sp. PAMC 29334]QYE36192.1 M48 family metalloprotease [Polymorphobacter sp. PAMC 29334]
MPGMPARLIARAALTLGAVAMLLGTSAPAAAQSVLRDAETESLFRDVARPLIIAAGLTPASVQIVLVGDPEINAFVSGGQNIFVFSGLIENADNVNQLQGVLAHELGHIAGGHNVRSNEGIGPATHISILSLVAAVALVAVGAGDAGIAALGLGTATAQSQYLAFSRDQESRADQAGAVFLGKAGESGRGSLEFFNKLLGQEYRLGLKQDNAYNRTHPLDGQRIAYLEAVYKASPAWNTPPDPKLDARFQRVKAKLAGFIEEPQRTFQMYPEGLKTEPARYAHAYAYHKSAYPDAAVAEVDALLALHPADPYYLELKGQILLESGKIAESLPILRAAVAAAPTEPLIATLLGHALVSTENAADFAEAKPLLRKAVVRDRENPDAWYQLGVIYDREGDTARAALATAERFDLQGEPRQAAANAKIALRGLSPGTTDWLRADDIAQVAQNDLVKKKHR